MTAIDDLSRPDGGIDPDIRDACTEIIQAAAAAGHTVPSCSWFNPASTPEHHVPGMAGKKGVANDFMTYQDREMGDWLASYIWRHRVRLGVRWIIWRDRIRSASPGKSGEWEARGQGDHYDHVHANFGGLVGQSGYGAVPRTAYRSLAPYVWDGKEFPGADRFDLGDRGAWITLLGQRLVAHGWTGYDDGPGPEFTKADWKAVQWFQEQQGWTGDDADGFPGPETWRRLLAEPVSPPAPAVPVEPAA